MDEKSYKRGDNYLSFFMGLDLRRVMFGTESWDSETLAAFVEDLKTHQGTAEQIHDVCCDMSPAFIKGIQAHLPKAEITLDRFHLMKLMNEALDAVRRAESPSTPGLKKTWSGSPRRVARSTMKYSTQGIINIHGCSKLSHEPPIPKELATTCLVLLDKGMRAEDGPQDQVGAR